MIGLATLQTCFAQRRAVSALAEFCPGDGLITPLTGLCEKMASVARADPLMTRRGHLMLQLRRVWPISSLMFVLIASLVIVACEESPAPSSSLPFPSSPSSPSSPSPRFAQSEIGLAVQSITANPGVLDAAATQQGRTVSAAVVVSQGTSKTRAKEIGDSFVRLLKTYGPDDAPGQSIGKGKFDYVIKVVYPNETIIAHGAKASIASRISW